MLCEVKGLSSSHWNEGIPSHTLFCPNSSSGRTPGGRVDKSLPANAGDAGSIPDLGRFHMH